MTLTSETFEISYTAAGTASEIFTVPFYFLSNSELRVISTVSGTSTLQTLNTNYTVTGAGVLSGGSITWVGTPTAGATIKITRLPAATQLTDYQETGDFPAQSHEQGMDRLTMLCQARLPLRSSDGQHWNFGNRQGKLCSNPTEALDVVNLQTLQAQTFLSSGTTIPTPLNPSQDGFVLTAASGSANWQNKGVPTPSAAALILRSTGSSQGNWAWAENAIGSGSGGGFLFNGDFRVAQRGTTFDGSTAPANSDDTYILDRWILLSAANDSVDITQNTTVKPTGAYCSLKGVQQIVGNKWGIVQVIEARDAAAMIGRAVTLSFKAYTPTGNVVANVRAAILSWSSTADSVTSDVVSAWGALGTNPTLAANWTAENTPTDNALVADTWTTYTIANINIDTASAANVAVFIWADNDPLSTGDVLYIADVRLELGAVANDYRPRPFQQEVAACQRFYCQSYNQGVNRATSTATGSELIEAGDTSGGESFQFPVLMRTAPTISLWSTVGVANQALQSGGAGVCDLTSSRVGDSRFNLNFSSATDNVTYEFQWIADAEL